MCRKICEQCGREYRVIPSRANTSRFCSRECMGKWYSENLRGENSHGWRKGKIRIVCEQCKKEFEVYPSQNNRRFCSRKCMGEWQLVNAPRGENHSCHKPKIKETCEMCHREYEVDQNRQNVIRFCSRECLGRWHSENRHGENSHLWKGGDVVKVCEQCGEEFKVRPSMKDERRFCSFECMGKWRSENWCGENNSAWKGGISFEPYCHKFNEAFKELIREKFGRVCFLCPTTEVENGKKLSVHHVNYDKDCLCDDSKCEFVPLCNKCHTRTNFKREYWEKTIMEKLHGTNKIF